MLANGFLILCVELGELVLDDLAHAHLGQFLGHQLLVEQATLDCRLVLHEGSDHLVQILLADPRRFLALGRSQTLDLDLELAGFLVEADVALVRIVAALAIVETRCRLVLRVLRLELKARRQHLLHQQAGGDGLQRIVDSLGHDVIGGGRFGDQVREAGAGLARRIAGCSADDLHDFGKAGAVAHCQRMFAPDPVKAFLRHAQRDDDVDVVTIVFLRRIFQRGGNAVPLGRIVID